MPGTFNPGGLNAPPKVIVNGCSDGTLLSVSSGGTTPGGLDSISAKKYLSGALTAGAYKELVSITGAGVINAAFVQPVMGDTTSRTIGLKITIDGVDVFSAISAASTIASDGLVGIGLTSAGRIGFAMITPEPKIFNLSLSISIRSSLTETDKLLLQIDYHTT